MMMIAFITIKSSLVPLIEGLCAQIYFRFEISVVCIIDHCMNLHTPWFTNTQTLPHRLHILGNPCSKTIDLQIPTQEGQTCMEAILLTLQIVGCQQKIIHKESEGIQVFTPNHISKGGPRHPGPTQSAHRPTQSPSPLHLSRLHETKWAVNDVLA